MGRKREITGKVVVYTDSGTKVIDAEVRHIFNAHGSSISAKAKCDEPHITICAARTIPTDNIHALKVCPQVIDAGIKYTQTKFFRLLLDLERLAQFVPINKFNVTFMQPEFDGLRLGKNVSTSTDFDWTASVPELDRQFYRHFDFSQAMIDFVEARYRYDDLRENQ